MIQSASLNAAFADFQDASSKVSRAAQRAAYVCLSRVKTMDGIQILQPFSPLLFARGSPIGSERLLRKLSKETSPSEALNEWMQGSEENDEAEEEDNDQVDGANDEGRGQVVQMEEEANQDDNNEEDFDSTSHSFL